MAATRDRKARLQARELARTPIVNPYRGQLHDPFRPESPPVQAAPELPYVAGMRESVPGTAVAAGVIAIVLAAFAVLSGFVLIAAITLEDTVGGVDRSFHQGSDASTLLLAAVDFPLAAAGFLGAITMLSGRLAGRLFLTVFGWFMLGESIYWLNRGDAPALIPLIVAVASIALLALGYHARVTRWLGVLAPVQPDW